jgi:tetratricopeptide (TPR) repeat protein
MSEVMNRASVVIFFVYAVLVIIAHLVGAVATSSVDWGVHHLGFLPLPLAAGILAAMGSLLLPAVQDLCAACARRITGSSHFGSGARIRGWSIFALGTVALEIVAREKTFFLGDGYLVTRDLGAVTRLAAIPTAFPTAPLAGWIALHLRDLWQLWGVSDAARIAWQSLSILSGLAFALVAWRLAFLCTLDRVRRLLFFLTILLGGWVQLFFGYVETYPPLAVALLTYIWLSLRFIRVESGLVWPTVVFAVMIATHVSCLLLVPSLVILFLHAVRRRRTREALVSAMCGGVALVFLMFICGTSLTGLWHTLTMGRGSLLPVIPGDNYIVPYGLFSSWHVLDLVNVVLLLFPLFPAIALFIIADSFRRRTLVGPAGLFAIAFALCAGGWCIFFKFDLGMSRDWDVVAPFFMGIAVLTAYAWYRAAPSSEQTGRVMIVALCLTGLHTAGWLAVNAGVEPSLRRAEMLPDERQWARRSLAYTYEDLGSFFRKSGDFTKAEFYTRAMVSFDSTNGRRWTALGYLTEMEGKTDEAIGAYRTGIRHGATDKGSFHSLAIALYRSSRPDEAIEVYRERLLIDPIDTIAALNMGLFYQQAKGDHEAAVKCFLMAAGIDSTLADTYRALGDSYRALRREPEATAAYARFRRLSAGRGNHPNGGNPPG